MTNQPKTCNDCIHFDYSFNTNRELCMRSGVGVCTKKIELVSYDDTECEDFEEDGE